MKWLESYTEHFEVDVLRQIEIPNSSPNQESAKSRKSQRKVVEKKMVEEGGKVEQKFV